MRSQFFNSEIISGVDVLSKNYYNLQLKIIYNTLLITTTCICSQKRVVAVIGLVFIFVILLLPIILKIKKVYREKTAIISRIKLEN